MLNLVSQAPFTAVSVADLRSHLNVSDTGQDSYLQSLIDAAKNYCERATGTDFSTTQWLLTLPHFPGAHWWRYGYGHGIGYGYPEHHMMRAEIRILRAPLQAITSIQYFDGSNTLQTIDPTGYYVEAPSFVGGIVQPSTYWPATFARPDAVRIAFTSGFQTLPPAAVHAMKLLCGSWYAAREDMAYGPSTVHGATGQAVEALLGQIRPGGYS